ncbi:hypothetical protein GCM10009557_87100 [Virgisporangium ochraceum]
MVPDESERFADRAEAGSALADEISRYLREHGVAERPLVLGMSRGGVPVAAEVARAIGADLDVIVVDAVGLPWKPDFKVGAIAENGPMVINHDKLTRADVATNDLAPSLSAARTELFRLADLYRDGRPATDVADRTVIVVDDGMQTGVRARAALRALHDGMPAHLVFATPVCAAEASGALEVEADGLVHLRCPCCFSATGLWYRDIPELTDADITGILRAERTLATAG